MALVAKSLDAATTVQTGHPVMFDVPKSDYSVQFHLDNITAGPTVVTNVTIDRNNWVPVDTRTLGSADVIPNLQTLGAPSPVTGIRVDLTNTNGGSTAVTATIGAA
jgi:hypothetical protein